MHASTQTSNIVARSYQGLVFKDYSLVIDNTPVAPDGFLRSAVVAGLEGGRGTFPGPTLTANKGENLRIRVRNELVDPAMRRSTTIVRSCIFVCELIFADYSSSTRRLCVALAWDFPEHHSLFRRPSNGHAMPYRTCTSHLFLSMSSCRC
jgi:hypothetical protein